MTDEKIIAEAQRPWRECTLVELAEYLESQLIYGDADDRPKFERWLRALPLATRPHKVMTLDEYVATPIIGWHEVCRDVDGFDGVGVRFLSEAEGVPRSNISLEDRMMEDDPKKIYLMPACEHTDTDQRCWCEDRSDCDQCGEEATEYVRADLIWPTGVCFSEGHPVFDAIDTGGGQTCDVSGVLRELSKAGFVIVPSKPSSEMVRRGEAMAWQGQRGLSEKEGRLFADASYQAMIRKWLDASWLSVPSQDSRSPQETETP